jgi:hypothetical protein
MNMPIQSKEKLIKRAILHLWFFLSPFGKGGYRGILK